MAELGFGNPGSSSSLVQSSGTYSSTTVGGIVVYDQGFGDKPDLFSDFTHVQNTFTEYQTDSAYQFTGFGDPTPAFIEVPFLANGISEYPDEGGFLVILEGKFDGTEDYYFQIKGQDGTVYPSSTTYCLLGS